MSKFKFKPEERSIIAQSIGLFQTYSEIIDRIEQIVSERDGWIDVKDRMPEKLALGQYETILICHYGKVRVGSWFANDFYNHSLNGTGQLEGVTHWQPLPSPPKQPTK